MKERILRLTKREQLLAAAIILVVTAYACWDRIVEPHQTRLSSTRAALDSRQGLLRAKRRSLAASARSSESLAEARRRLGELDRRYLAAADATGFLGGLSELVSGAGCRLVKINFLSEEKAYRRELTGGGATVSETTLVGEGASWETTGRVTAICSKVRLRLFIDGRFQDLLELLERIQATSEGVRLSRMRLEVIEHDRADVTASFVLTLFSLEEQDVEEV